MTPGPLTLMLQVTPFDLAPVWQREDIRTFPFHEIGALVCRSHVAHALRIAQPTLGHDHRWGQCHAASATKQRGKHHTTHSAQQLLLAPQAPFDLGHQAVGEAQGTEGLLQGLGGLLRLEAVTLEALSGMKAAALSGFGMFFRASCAGGHGVRLCSV